MMRRHGTDYRPLIGGRRAGRRAQLEPPCPECGAPAGEPCASWCSSRARHPWRFWLEAAITFALFCLCVYLGAGGEAWPH